MKRHFLIFTFIIMILTSCGPSEQEIQASLELTRLASITDTPSPTTTPTLTPTLTPTFTPMAKDMPIVEEIIQEENFDSLDDFNFEINGNFDFKNGIMVLEDPLNSGDVWADGSASIFSTFSIVPDHGYVLLFQALPETEYLITFERGPFGDPSFRAFWIWSFDTYSIWDGRGAIINRETKIDFKYDTWYFLLMRVKSEGVEAKLWAKDNPEMIDTIEVKTGEEWIKDDLRLVVHAVEGTVEIDEFQEVVFFQ